MKIRTIIIILSMIATLSYVIYKITKVSPSSPGLECKITQITTKCLDGTMNCINKCPAGESPCGKDPCNSVCTPSTKECVNGIVCDASETCGDGVNKQCCVGKNKMCNYMKECVTCDSGDACANKDTCCELPKTCCGNHCCDEGKFCGNPDDGTCCDSKTQLWIDSQCCELNKIYKETDSSGKVIQKCCTNGNVCYNPGPNGTYTTSCCPDNETCTTPSTCDVVKGINGSPDTNQCSYTDQTTKETKYVKIPGKYGCKLDPDTAKTDEDPNSKCDGWNQISTTCYKPTSTSDGTLAYTKTACDPTDNTLVHSGTQCSVKCSGTGLDIKSIYCPTGDTCSTLTVNKETTPYCLLDNGPTWQVASSNPEQITTQDSSGSTLTINTCAQYYQVDLTKMGTSPACLLYDTITGGTPLTLVKPVTDMDGKSYCPISYSTTENNYNTVPLSLDEDSLSGLSTVQLTPTGYTGYGDGGSAGNNKFVNNPATKTGGAYPDSFFSEKEGVKSAGFQFGPYVHGVATNIEPVLMSSKRSTYSGGKQQPRLVDCLNLYSENGLHDINLDTNNKTCSAHFSCDKFLRKKDDMYPLLKNNTVNMIPTGAVEDKWTGGYCANGGEISTGIITDSDGQPLTDFTRCKIMPSIRAGVY